MISDYSGFGSVVPSDLIIESNRIKLTESFSHYKITASSVYSDLLLWKHIYI